MKKSLIRFTTLILSVVLLVSASGCATYNYKADTTIYSTDNFDFQNLAYEAPDIDRYNEVSAILIEKSAGFLNFLAVLNYYQEFVDIYNKFSLELTLLQINSYLDVNNTETVTLYNELLQKNPEIDETMESTMYALSKSKCAWFLKMSCGSDIFDEYKDYTEKTADEKIVDELKVKENELLNSYYDLAKKEYTVKASDYTYEYELPKSIQKDKWTLADIDGLYDDWYITSDTYKQMQEDYYKQMNSDYVNILIELTKVRKKIASSSGYDSYAEYCYTEVYDRDYTPSQVTGVSENVVKYYTEIYSQLEDDIDWGYIDDANKLAVDVYNTKLSSEVKKILTSIDNDLSTVYSDMETKKTYNIAYSEDKRDGSFTTYFSTFELPYMYIQPEGGANPNVGDVSTVFHEFGRYAALSGDISDRVPEDIDSCEVASVGLELLATSYYSDLYTKAENAENARKYVLYNTIGNILEGFMYDEFQRYLFTVDEEELTTENINNQIYRLYVKYGLLEADETDEEAMKTAQLYAWVNDTLTFDSPFYYVSYGVASAAAVQIWASESPIQTYNQFVDNMNSKTLSENLEALGFDNILKEGAAKSIAEKVSAKLSYNLDTQEDAA